LNVSHDQPLAKNAFEGCTSLEEIYVYGDSWTITNISPVQNGIFTFEQSGMKYRATINKKYRHNNGCLIVDIKQI